MNPGSGNYQQNYLQAKEKSQNLHFSVFVLLSYPERISVEFIESLLQLELFSSSFNHLSNPVQKGPTIFALIQVQNGAFFPQSNKN